MKMDDIGLALSQRKSELAQRVGVGMVRFMPVLLSVISTVGVAAMLWVGGHIILVGLDDLGWHWLYDVVHHWEEDVEHAWVPWAAPLPGWSTPSPPPSSVWWSVRSRSW